jgi:hypothetical protein
VIGGLSIVLGLLGALYPGALPYILPMIVCTSTPESVTSVQMWYNSSVVNTFNMSEYLLRGLCIGFGFVLIINTLPQFKRPFAQQSFAAFIISYSVARLVWNLYLGFSSLGLDTILVYWGHPTSLAANSAAAICCNTNQRLSLTYSSLMLLIFLYCLRVVRSYSRSEAFLGYSRTVTTPIPLSSNPEDHEMFGRPLTAEEAASLDIQRLSESGVLYNGAFITH